MHYSIFSSIFGHDNPPNQHTSKTQCISIAVSHPIKYSDFQNRTKITRCIVALVHLFWQNNFWMTLNLSQRRKSEIYAYTRRAEKSEWNVKYLDSVPETEKLQLTAHILSADTTRQTFLADIITRYELVWRWQFEDMHISIPDIQMHLHFYPEIIMLPKSHSTSFVDSKCMRKSAILCHFGHSNIRLNHFDHFDIRSHEFDHSGIRSKDKGFVDIQ